MDLVTFNENFIRRNNIDGSNEAPVLVFLLIYLILKPISLTMTNCLMPLEFG